MRRIWGLRPANGLILFSSIVIPLSKVSCIRVSISLYCFRITKFYKFGREAGKAAQLWQMSEHSVWIEKRVKAERKGKWWQLDELPGRVIYWDRRWRLVAELLCELYPEVNYSGMMTVTYERKIWISYVWASVYRCCKESELDTYHFVPTHQWYTHHIRCQDSSPSCHSSWYQ